MDFKEVLISFVVVFWISKVYRAHLPVKTKKFDSTALLTLLKKDTWD